jgi:hypothetical protein
VLLLLLSRCPRKLWGTPVRAEPIPIDVVVVILAAVSIHTVVPVFLDARVHGRIGIVAVEQCAGRRVPGYSRRRRGNTIPIRVAVVVVVSPAICVAAIVEDIEGTRVDVFIRVVAVSILARRPHGTHARDHARRHPEAVAVHVREPEQVGFGVVDRSRAVIVDSVPTALQRGWIHGRCAVITVVRLLDVASGRFAGAHHLSRIAEAVPVSVAIRLNCVASVFVHLAIAVVVDPVAVLVPGGSPIRVEVVAVRAPLSLRGSLAITIVIEVVVNEPVRDQTALKCQSEQPAHVPSRTPDRQRHESAEGQVKGRPCSCSH